MTWPHALVRTQPCDLENWHAAMGTKALQSFFILTLTRTTMKIQPD